MAPMVQGSNIFVRFYRIIKDFFIHPLDNLKIFFVDDWSKRTHILLYMESIDSTLRLVRSRAGFIFSKPEKGPLPTAFNPKAQEIAKLRPLSMVKQWS